MHFYTAAQRVLWQGMDDLPKITMRTVIGIAVAITGNILISLALNLQKLAHKRVEKEKKVLEAESRNDHTSLDERDEDLEAFRNDPQDDVFTDRPTTDNSELRPLVAHPEPMVRDYGSDASGLPVNAQVKLKRSFMSRIVPSRARGKAAVSKLSLLPVDIVTEDAALHGLAVRKKGHSPDSDSPDTVEGNEGEYLKSKLWWLGFLLMNVGEMGNFISYAFAPASVVAPLGTFALMANCFFAPLLLGEYFRKRDLFGVAIAIIGAVTVVLASNASDAGLDPEALLHAISQTSFIAYSCVYVAGAITLGTLSEGRLGKRWVFIDVGLCALFGGFTVLSTKALSTLLTSQWIEIFTQWITYPLIATLILTGVGQIRYLNRALMRFDSKVVIPIQFVLFTLSAIIGSAILYGDFQKAKFHEIVTFLYGCAATFTGVFIIAWSPTDSSAEHSADVIPEEEAQNTNDATPTNSDGARLGMGTIGRRRHATLVLPSGVNGPRETPALRHKRSGVGVMAISPAQHLLLVHAPPRETPLRDREDNLDIERGGHTPTGRRRTMSWYGSDGQRSGNGTRESSLVGRLRNGLPRVGSLEGQPNTLNR
ncbi:unnamed protein product [Cyclocybe aegerita]|uniref:DUF803-domain-containing protein n=1 Tax=Cyclocybe aegerita TaxID=1973307 RepID=A0A8S0WV86_CYCAE|nr:unnamed protein product [Cyclocybe aegerita]